MKIFKNKKLNKSNNEYSNHIAMVIIWMKNWKCKLPQPENSVIHHDLTNEVRFLFSYCWPFSFWASSEYPFPAFRLLYSRYSLYECSYIELAKSSTRYMNIRYMNIHYMNFFRLFILWILFIYRIHWNDHFEILRRIFELNSCFH